MILNNEKPKVQYSIIFIMLNSQKITFCSSDRWVQVPKPNNKNRY